MPNPDAKHLKQDALATKTDQIIVVPSSIPGRGVCVECGNGLWPGQPPCKHKRSRGKQEAA